jgi:hypothetical protein
MAAPDEALTVACPACNAQPGQPCTVPTDTSRKLVSWVHLARRASVSSDYYLTFGIQYNEEPHPHWPECNPKGWVRITAPTYEQARDIACSRFGLDWSQLIPKLHFNPAYFPAGELMVLP